jgi:polyisoprenoid-binding protein YceI
VSPADLEALPVGIWEVDHEHSSIIFAVDRPPGTFRGRFTDFDAYLEHGTLTGSVMVSSVEVRDEDLAAHLLGPEFFDVEVHPERSFASTAVERDGDEVRIAGALTVKGHTGSVEVTGTITDPLTDANGGQSFVLTLRAVVDRDRFGSGWFPPPPGGGAGPGREVAITAELRLARVGAGQS